MESEPTTPPTTIPIPEDIFDEWLAAPLGRECEDPRFVVERARPEQFEAVYDCVDLAFGRKRDRALYRWLYEQNPYGLARIWILRVRDTGQILKTGGFYPWPIWRGDRPRAGSLSGDSGTIPEWQRKGLARLRRVVRRSHPMSSTFATIAGPNEGSRIVGQKAGEASTMVGELTGGVVVLRGAPLAERAGLPAAVARPVGALAGGLFGAWRRATLRPRDGLRFEVIDRCRSDLDAVTLATMRFPHWWSPHNATFLNWRYLDHPVEDYQALALVDPTRDRPVAYAVVRLAGDEGTLAEFAAAPEHGPTLLAQTLAFAREAGCGSLNFFGTPVWRHWGLFRRAGFLPYRTNNFLDASDWEDKDVSEDIRKWQLTPGDRDYH